LKYFFSEWRTIKIPNQSNLYATNKKQIEKFGRPSCSEEEEQETRVLYLNTKSEPTRKGILHNEMKG
jgi:hypothetical protein